MGLTDSRLRLVFIRKVVMVWSRGRRHYYIVNGRFLSHYRVPAGVLVEMRTMGRRVLTVSRPRVLRGRVRVGQMIAIRGMFAAHVGPSAHCYYGGFGARLLFRRHLRVGIYSVAYRFVSERLALAITARRISD